MREGWKYKKLGDVCAPKKEIKRASKAFSPNDEIAYIDISSIDNSSQKMTGCTNYVLSDAPSRAQQCVQNGDIIVSTVRPNLKNIAIVDSCDTNLVASSGFCVLRPSNIERQYLFYYITSEKFTNHLIGLTTGANYPAVRDSDILGSMIPVPPISVQNSIVSELDKINELIRLKKEQLNDYDKLAQSIFYEMFGDPVENCMGWEVKHIGDFGTCIAGATPSTTVEEYWTGGTIPWLSSGEVSKGRIFNTDKRITQHGYDSCSTRMIPAHTIVIAMAGQGKTRGTVGVAEIPLCTNQSKCSIVTNENIDVDFLYYQIKYLYNELRSASNGDGGRGGLNLRLIQKFPIISPNYSLQGSFAKRIKTVELLKSNIQSTIQDLETLLASRMQYWFD